MVLRRTVGPATGKEKALKDKKKLDKRHFVTYITHSKKSSYGMMSNRGTEMLNNKKGRYKMKEDTYKNGLTSIRKTKKGFLVEITNGCQDLGLEQGGICGYKKLCYYTDIFPKTTDLNGYWRVGMTFGDFIIYCVDDLEGKVLSKGHKIQ